MGKVIAAILLAIMIGLSWMLGHFLGQVLHIEKGMEILTILVMLGVVSIVFVFTKTAGEEAEDRIKPWMR